MLLLAIYSSSINAYLLCNLNNLVKIYSWLSHTMQCLAASLGSERAEKRALYTL